MEVELTPEAKSFARMAIESGRLAREEDAVMQALEMWVERERYRMELIAAVEIADAEIARGEGRIITEESMEELKESVKRRGRARLLAEQQQT
jgi:Arc/MetJ-type ribon-helix-helix transcriptional regulator